MSKKRKILDQQGLNYLTITTVGWVDIFTREVYRTILIDSLKYCINNKGLLVHSYVIMSNHLHLLASTQSPFELSSVLRDFKAHTAKMILLYLQNENHPESRRKWLLHVLKYHAFGRKNQQTYQVWQSGNHPVLLYSKKVILQKLQYIHLNPVRAGFVAHPRDWLYSSALFYETGEGLLDITTLDIAFHL